jgi:tetratricopeptide (TPR) repeat protein
MERGDRDPASEAVLRNLQAYIELQQGRPEQALELALRALTLWQQANHHHVAVGHHTIAASLNELGRMDEALSHEREALQRWERDLGPQHPNTGAALLSLGISEDRRGLWRAAIADFERALAIFERTGTRGGIPRVLLSLAIAHRRVDQPKRAREMVERCLTVSTESLGPQSSVTIGCRIVLGKLELADGDVAGAVAVFTEVLASLRSDRKDRSGRAALADASFGLARALWQRAAHRDRARALELAEDAEAIYGEIRAMDDDRDEAARWIAARRATVRR